MKTSEKRYAFLLRNITAILMTFAATCALNAWLLLEINAIFLLAAALTADVLFAVLDHFKKKLMLWVTLAAAVIVAAVVLELTGISVRSLLREVSSWVREAFLWLEVFTESEESLRLPEPVLPVPVHGRARAGNRSSFRRYPTALLSAGRHIDLR